MKVLHRIAFCCLGLLMLARVRAEELSLEQVIALVLKNQRGVANARLEVEKSERQIEVARTYRLPSFRVNVFEGQLLHPVDFLFPAGAFGVYSATGPIPGKDSTITTPRHPFTLVNGSLTQPLSQLPRIRMGIRIRETERDAAHEKLDAMRQAVVSKARKAYYGILQTQSAVIANASAIRTLRELDRVASDSVAQQIALKSEALEVKARLAKAEYESASLLHALASGKEQLNDLMGRDARTEFSVRDLPDPSLEAGDLSKAREQALSDRPEIREAKLRIREAEQDRDLKRAEFIPAVDFTVQYFSPFQINLLPKNIAAAGVQLNWDVFDWGRKKKELAVKELVIQQAKNDLESTRGEVLLEVESRYRKVEESRRMLHVIELAQEAARERVRVAADRHATESALLKDLLEAQETLAETDYQYRQVLSSYLSAQADFDQAAANKVGP